MIWSVAILAATNSDPKVAVSTVALLDDDDGETQMKASEQSQTVSGTASATLGCEQVGQADNILSPADQDQHHENARENVCGVGATTPQREADARAGSRDQDQNFYVQNGHPKRANEKHGSEFKRANEKSMTYREALLGIEKSKPTSEDNSEPSSDF